MPYAGEPDVYDTDAAEPSPRVSDRSRGLALGFGIVGGFVGLHRFYAGYTKSAVWMILTLGGVGIWWFYDLVLLATGEFRDAEGRPIRRWEVGGGERSGAAGRGSGGLARLSEQVERLERDVAELAERLDFAERLLAQQRDRNRLPS